MKKQYRNSGSFVSVIIFMVGFGLVMGCSKKQEEMAESSESAMAEQQAMEQEPMGEAQTFEATLSGSNEVPPVTTDASGTFSATLEGNSITVTGKFSGLSSKYVGSHIHEGAKGENGGPIQSLDPSLGSDSLSGSWDASYQLDEAQISALKEGNLYINVHSANHKSGELRGQLTASGSGM